MERGIISKKENIKFLSYLYEQIPRDKGFPAWPNDFPQWLLEQIDKCANCGPLYEDDGSTTCPCHYDKLIEAQTRIE